MHVQSRYWTSLLIVFLACLAESPSAAAWSLALAGRVERVVAAGDRVAAVRGGTVILLREDGAPLGRVEDVEAAPARRKSHASAREEEDVLDFLGINEGEQNST
jgi:hypothetical protein